MKNINMVISAAKWKMIEKFGSKGVQVVIQVILARLLMPDDYGTLAILTVFISLANVFIQTGFSTALIQKYEVDDEDFSTCLYASLGIAVALYIMIWITSPWIADFYNMDEIAVLLKVLAIVLFAGAINSIQYAYISRKLQFKNYTLSTVISSIVSGVVGIWLAYKNWGIWALVCQQLLANAMSVVLLFFMTEWKPKLLFSFEKLRNIWSYGWKILGMGLLSSMYSSLYTLVVGKVFSSEVLGLYNRADQFPNLLAANINDTVQAVTLPVLSQRQKEKEAFVERLSLALKANAFVLVPCMLGMSAVAPEMIEILLTDKWLEATLLMRILCCIYATYPIHTMNIQAIKASGRSDIVLLTEIIKKIIDVSTLIITVRFGLVTMLAVQLISSVSIGLMINTTPTYKLYGYGILSQMSDVWKCYVSSFIMAAGVMAAGVFLKEINIIAKFLIMIILGIMIFTGCELLFKDKIMYVFAGVLKSKTESMRGLNKWMRK